MVQRRDRIRPNFGIRISFVISHSSLVISLVLRQFPCPMLFVDDSRSYGFDHIKSYWDDENSQQGRGEHAANDRGAHGFAGDAAGAGSEPEGYAAEHEGEGSHENGPQPDARAG